MGAPAACPGRGTCPLRCPPRCPLRCPPWCPLQCPLRCPPGVPSAVPSGVPSIVPSDVPPGVPTGVPGPKHGFLCPGPRGWLCCPMGSVQEKLKLKEPSSLPIPDGVGPPQGSKGKAVPPGVINGGIWAERQDV